ncbi:hypothetical protein [uncultured Piscinibacter sp.]|uniref:hypothetical protein n=1 Tax=uncultured Piscinibacter sp. TaxID=1131835 RepID=UPI00262E87CC|nr:hypothetical protein [uncultured Piscinibacter sp.]
MNQFDPNPLHIVLGRRSVLLLGGVGPCADAMINALAERFPGRAILVSVDDLADDDVLLLPTGTSPDELADFERQLRA